MRDKSSKGMLALKPEYRYIRSYLDTFITSVRSDSILCPSTTCMFATSNVVDSVTSPVSLLVSVKRPYCATHPAPEPSGASQTWISFVLRIFVTLRTRNLVMVSIKLCRENWSWLILGDTISSTIIDQGGTDQYRTYFAVKSCATPFS